MKYNTVVSEFLKEILKINTHNFEKANFHKKLDMLQPCLNILPVGQIPKTTLQLLSKENDKIDKKIAECLIELSTFPFLKGSIENGKTFEINPIFKKESLLRLESLCCTSDKYEPLLTNTLKILKKRNIHKLIFPKKVSEGQMKNICLDLLCLTLYRILINLSPLDAILKDYLIESLRRDYIFYFSKVLGLKTENLESLKGSIIIATFADGIIFQLMYDKVTNKGLLEEYNFFVKKKGNILITKKAPKHLALIEEFSILLQDLLFKKDLHKSQGNPSGGYLMCGTGK